MLGVFSSNSCIKEVKFKSGGFLQVLNSGNSHWVAFSTVNCSPGVVHWLNSMHGGPLSDHEKIIADIMQSMEEKLKIKILNVQLQHGGADCGLFALANITAILQGVSCTSVYFGQKLMRSHLTKCLQLKDPRPFPVSRAEDSLSRTPEVLHTISIPLFCYCRLPDDGELMVCCSRCQQWYHQVCTPLMGLTEKKVKKITWQCKMCAD